jgi:hypothetical protein
VTHWLGQSCVPKAQANITNESLQAGVFNVFDEREYPPLFDASVEGVVGLDEIIEVLEGAAASFDLSSVSFAL